MDEFIKAIVQIGGPTAIVAAVGLWLYLRVDSQRVAAEAFVREHLAKAVEADTRMSIALESLARTVERGKP